MATQMMEEPVKDPLVSSGVVSPEVIGHLKQMKEEAYQDGVFPAKVKILTSLAISIAIRCEPCINSYVQKAVALGVTREELGEFLNVAIAMGGCPGEAWAFKALRAYDLVSKASQNREPHNTRHDDSCCKS